MDLYCDRRRAYEGTPGEEAGEDPSEDASGDELSGWWPSAPYWRTRVGLDGVAGGEDMNSACMGLSR